MAQIRDVIADCRHPASLTRFWAAVLDGYDVAPYDDAELARLREMGIDDVEDDPTVLVEAPGVFSRFFFQRVDESKAVKNRWHLDLVADDPDAEFTRLLALGATVVADRRQSHNWITMADPEGNEVCLPW